MSRAGVEQLIIGQVLGPHGNTGEVRVLPLTDFPERLGVLRRTVLRLPSGEREIEVEASRPHGRFYLFRFLGYDDRDAAAGLRGAYLTVPVEDAVPLPQGHYYHYQIVGLQVQEAGGRCLGKVREIVRTGANDVYMVAREGQADLLLPALKAVVTAIDLERGVLIIRPLEEWSDEG